MFALKEKYRNVLRELCGSVSGAVVALSSYSEVMERHFDKCPEHLSGKMVSKLHNELPVNHPDFDVLNIWDQANEDDYSMSDYVHQNIDSIDVLLDQLQDIVAQIHHKISRLN